MAPIIAPLRWCVAPERRTAMLLAACQTFITMAQMLIIASVSLAATLLLEDPSWATMPLTLQFLATALMITPAAYVMRRYGYRTGFLISAILAIIGGLAGAYALYYDMFLLFCFAGVCQGITMAFAMFYRYAAAETVKPADRATTMSIVLSGGILAAILGPELAVWSNGWFGPYQFVGVYVSVSLLAACIMIVLSQLKINIHVSDPDNANTMRPMKVILTQPRFIMAALASMIGYGSMTFIMTATPLAMQVCGYDFNETAFVIEWHVLAMYGPSLFSGWLINKMGLYRMLIIGCLLYLATIAINLHGVTELHFWSALVCLGIGWNFLFLGGSTLVVQTYYPQEKAKAQSVHDVIMFTVVAVGSLSAGYLQSQFGWDLVNIAILPFVMIVMIAVFWLSRHPQAALAAE